MSGRKRKAWKASSGLEAGDSHAEGCIASALEIPFVDSKDLTVSRFIEDFMIPNRPVVIRGLVEGWQAAVGPPAMSLCPLFLLLSHRFVLRLICHSFYS